MKEFIRIRKIDRSAPTEILDALVQLHRELDQQEIEVAKLPPVNVLEGYTGWFDSIEKCLDEVDVYGAFIDEQLVGFISYRTYKTYRGIIGGVSYLYVTQEHRRKGVARKLWDTVEEFFRVKYNVHYVTLDVYVTNTDAINFYESIGFSPYIQSMAYKL